MSSLRRLAVSVPPDHKVLESGAVLNHTRPVSLDPEDPTPRGREFADRLKGLLDESTPPVLVDPLEEYDIPVRIDQGGTPVRTGPRKS